MTYREAFDATGKPRKPPCPPHTWCRVAMHWIGVAAGVLAWAYLVGWLDGAK